MIKILINVRKLTYVFCLVEGTICPISFVKETLVGLFPDHIDSFSSRTPEFVHGKGRPQSSKGTIPFCPPYPAVLLKSLTTCRNHHKDKTKPTLSPPVPLRPRRPPHRPRHAMGLASFHPIPHRLPRRARLLARRPRSARSRPDSPRHQSRLPQEPARLPVGGRVRQRRVRHGSLRRRRSCFEGLEVRR